MANHFGGIIDNSMKNGLQINLKDAIEDVGVKVPDSTCLWEYPEVIRKNLIAKTISNINLKGKDMISITPVSNDNDMTYEISTSIDTSSLSRPNYAKSNSGWGNSMNGVELVKDLFTNILPAVRGVHSGDVSVTDPDGVDSQDWVNPAFNLSGRKTGLEPNSRYIRLYMTCQAEPVFINMGNVVKDLTGGYNIKNSDTVIYELNETDMTLSTHINVITDSQMNELN
jgi:hypothetical protein